MSRSFCYRCHRAKVNCLCDHIKPQDNQISVILLQHPDEVSHARGSGVILKLGLSQLTCWVGEDFSEHEGLRLITEQNQGRIALLYPGEQACNLDQGLPASQPQVLIVIDASWRKAYRIYQLCPMLQLIPKVSFDDQRQSNYRIRKAPAQGQLSTVESVVTALRLLEGKPQGYSQLIQVFEAMIDRHIECMGESTYQRNYSGDEPGE